jgi:hypothetical protein
MMMRSVLATSPCLGCWLLICLATGISPLLAEPWQRHTIDGSSRGADGVRLADANGDGRLDIATGWEEGGVVRVYLNPGPARVRTAWPHVTVGAVKSPEDAVLVDLDGDQRMDVVSCCEGAVRTVFVHWAPSARSSYLDSSAWQTTALPATAGKQMWMYAVPLQVDGKHGVDLLLGSKGNGATVGWLQAPADARRLQDWTYHPLYKAGWIMSLAARDLDADGDQDVIVSDRKGPSRGLLWLEHPGGDASGDWREHRIGADGLEVMFLAIGDLDQDRREDILLSTRNARMLAFYRMPGKGVRWRSEQIPNPHGMPLGKAVAIADLDGDGRTDIVHDTNTGGDRSHPGVTWLTRGKATTGPWLVRDISGMEGIKFDLLATIDLDGDGDLDVIGCEERDNLGVFWYENPLGK